MNRDSGQLSPNLDNNVLLLPGSEKVITLHVFVAYLLK